MARFANGYHCQRSSRYIVVSIGPYLTKQETNTGYMRMSHDVYELFGPPGERIIRTTQVGRRRWTHSVSGEHIREMEKGWLDG